MALKVGKKKRLPDNFGDCSLTKSVPRKIFEGEMLIRTFLLQISIKYFANVCFIWQLFSKV